MATPGLCHPFSHSLPQTREVLTWHEGAQRHSTPSPSTHHQFLHLDRTNSSGAQITAQGQGTVAEQAGQGGRSTVPCPPHTYSCFFDKMLKQLREQQDQQLMGCGPAAVLPCQTMGHSSSWSPRILVPKSGGKACSPGWPSLSRLQWGLSPEADPAAQM